MAQLPYRSLLCDLRGFRFLISSSVLILAGDLAATMGL